jgi:hypothetical protein
VYLDSDSVHTLVVPWEDELSAYPLDAWNKIRCAKVCFTP